jgi:cobyrinic acid a,c-diamide synthase
MSDDPKHTIPRLVVAGTSSGVGKTTTTVALCGALRARGLDVALFKCGPDYLDPTYHRRAAGRPAQTLDSWMMGRDAMMSTFVSAARGADVALVEGMMGLFDGESPTGERGSTAEIAKWLGAPVLLVLDASGVARSVAAMVAGFAGFDPALSIAGVVCNRVGGPGHVGLLRQAQKSPPIWGGLRGDSRLSFPERHLGLRTADEKAVPDALLAGWAAEAEAGIDLDAVLSVARSAPLIAAPSVPSAHGTLASTEGRRCRIGIAFDDAFHFYYDENLRLLERAGAELVRFSPLDDGDLPSVDGIYIGGGYPEVFGARLAENQRMRAAVSAFVDRGGVVYAECGGLMYLSAAIETLDGTRHPMVGVIPQTAVMSPRLEAIGYVDVETRLRTPLGPAGVSFRGHQFRYSRLEDRAEAGVSADVALAYSVRPRSGVPAVEEGFVRGNLLASYVHGHWASNPEIASNLVETCIGARGAVLGERVDGSHQGER